MSHRTKVRIVCVVIGFSIGSLLGFILTWMFNNYGAY